MLRGILLTHLVSFLFDTSPEELLWRVEWAWTQVVAAEVSHRPGLADFACVDVQATRLWLRSLNALKDAGWNAHHPRFQTVLPRS
jgi:hypothetical protein